MIEFFDTRIKGIDRQLSELVSGIPEAHVLTKVRRIGVFSAAVICSEKVFAYAGLAPSTHESGAYARYGRITHQGSRYLRCILTECVQVRGKVRHQAHQILNETDWKSLQAEGYDSMSDKADEDRLLDAQEQGEV